MAKAIRRNNAVKLLGVTRRNRPYLMMSTALQATVAVVISFPAAALSPNAQPTGGTVQAGNIGISQNSTTTTIDQATQKGIIQWQQFNVGSQQTVQFNVPSAASSTLNRVVSPNPSQIAGKINSNGQVIIENQSGVMFLDGAQINTNGLMATAIGISDRNYLAGKMVLDRGGNPNAQVVNQGTITIAGAGLAALVAPAVRNSGTINAKMGNVVLAGGQAVTLDMYGDGLVSVNVTKQVTQAPDGVTSLVTNDGTIRAAGGTVQLTAAAADGVVQNLVTAGGKISARSMGEKTGTVSIAGIGGNIEITGQIGAEGIAAGTVGGTIAMTATGNVAVKGTAVVNASGKAGGGTVSIGTMPDRTRTATNTRIAAGATIKADATDKGNGGTVVVLSDAATSMAGSISAKGGPNGGNGGFVEVSGNTGFSLTGKIDVSAGKGVQGTILIDPQDLEIKAAGANDGDVAAGGVDVATPDQDTDRSVSAAVLTALNGSLVIEASRDLTVNADLVFANQTAGKSVTMLAGRDFTVNNAISTAGGDLTLKAAVSTDGVTAFTHFDAAGKLTINAAIGDASTGAINLSAGTGGIALAANVTTPATLSLVSTGAIAQTNGVVSADTLTGSSDTGASLTKANTVNKLGAFTNTTSGLLSVTNNQALTTTGAVTSGGDTTLTTTAGSLTLGANVSSGAAKTVTLNAFTSLSQTGGVISGDTL
ncbi:MAG: filamentous hemagglutinin N-terminal domain-containing protein, partial [Rhodospirillales bacterium]